MPSVPYMNQSAPFWDFVANFEKNFEHPSSQGDNNDNINHADQTRFENRPAPPPHGPWGWGFPGFANQGFPHRSRNYTDEMQTDQSGEKADGKGKNVTDNGEGPSNDEMRSEHHTDNYGPKPRGRCGRGGFGSPHHHGFGPPHHHGFGHGHHGHGGGGPWGGRGPFGHGFDPLGLAATLFEQAQGHKGNKDDSNTDFAPDSDVFDTPASFVVHVSLPGAKKEDIGVSWDAEKSELVIAGVIYRPGSEELLKTLAMSERKAGPFERKIRLGTMASPAQIDADMITAKLEDGVLKIDVPKMLSGFVEVRKVEIQ